MPATPCYPAAMPDSARLRRPATYEDLREVPDAFVAEILDGELYATPRPSIPHIRTGSRLGAVLGPPFDEGRGGPGGWVLLDEPELHLGPDVLVPDVAGWRQSRLPSLPNEPFLTLVPDWVCEILSPSTERMDRVHKLAIYAREGAAHAWLVNPLLRTLEVLRLEQNRWVVVTTHSAEIEPLAIEPFEAVPIELSRIWPSSV
jgi:Uma2 family endonuclease